MIAYKCQAVAAMASVRAYPRPVRLRSLPYGERAVVELRQAEPIPRRPFVEQYLLPFVKAAVARNFQPQHLPLLPIDALIERLPAIKWLYRLVPHVAIAHRERYMSVVALPTQRHVSLEADRTYEV